MNRLALLLVLIALTAGASRLQQPPSPQPPPAPAADDEERDPDFSPAELRAFTALEPIDTHTHVFLRSGAFNAMLRRLHLHILDICVIDDHDKYQKALEPQLDDALSVVRGAGAHASLATTFDPFPFSKPGYSAAVVSQLNRDFGRGAVAVKIWKNVGMEIEDAQGRYLLPDNPVFAPIYQDIAAHHKTLIAHVADPDSIWQAPNPAAPDYSYYMEHPEWYMFRKAHPASKEAILAARDRVVEQNPGLRVVGAHLGSMEANLEQLGRRLDRYPNFAVDLAARMPYLMMLPRDRAIAFVTRYQDRLIYGTDLGLKPGDNPAAAVDEWQRRYARQWRFLGSSGTVEYQKKAVQGLALPEPVLRKLYHENAVRWFPGIAAGGS